MTLQMNMMYVSVAYNLEVIVFVQLTTTAVGHGGHNDACVGF